ncbi:MAG: redoxin domain-containing protein [Bacteroidia bacterium]|nr:redoxin domain-containing protein [Bacteroidia bacterium]
MKLLFILLLLLQSYTRPDLESVKLRSIDGEFCYIENNKKLKATILFFVTPECPLCQSYSLNIKQLANRYQKKGYRFIAIIPGKTISPAQVIKYKSVYNLQSITFYFDPSFELVHLLKATVTPQVFVLDQTGNLLYNGQIDNWIYELGKKRKVITEHNLEKILSDIDQNRKIIFQKTKVLGCFIE